MQPLPDVWQNRRDRWGLCFADVLGKGIAFSGLSTEATERYTETSRFDDGALMSEDDLEFYQSREQDERRLAANASDPRVIGIHLEMAAGYAKLVAIARTSAVAHELERA